MIIKLPGEMIRKITTPEGEEIENLLPEGKEYKDFLWEFEVGNEEEKEGVN